MSIGAQHYRLAEQLLAAARDHSGPVLTYQDEALQIAEAQVHATLALAAATAYPAIRDYCGDEASDGGYWTRVTSP